jgi:hypothetical protein
VAPILNYDGYLGDSAIGWRGLYMASPDGNVWFIGMTNAGSISIQDASGGATRYI